MKKLRRIVSFMLCIVLALSLMPGQMVRAEAREDLANSWRYANGQPFSLLSDGEFTEYTTWPEVEGAVANGIDVSHHNGEINWEKVKAAGVDYAILRCGYGDNIEQQDDRRWVYNADECTRLDIPFGVYIYSYAVTVEEAESEADHVLRLIEGYELDYPVYYDLEDNSQLELSASELALIAKTFCDKIEAAGYEVGIYANTYWFNNVLTDSVFNQWPRWCAQYNETCTYQGEYTMWQCSSKGEVDGISSYVDLNVDFGSRVESEKTYTQYRVMQGDINYRTGAGTANPIAGKLTLNRVIDVEDGYAEKVGSHTWVRFLMNGQIYYVAATYLKKASEAPVVMTFSDVSQNEWYYEYIKYVYENGYMNGMGDTSFSPDAPLTRAQFATMLYRIAGSPTVTKTTKFTDVKADEWYTDAVLWAFEAGIVNGYSDTVFGTNDSIQREQMVTMMYRYAKYQNQDVAQTMELSGFSDASKISEFAVVPMKWAVASGLINGIGDQLEPAGSTTRAQSATVFTRFIKQ